MYRLTQKAAARRTELAEFRRARDAARMAEPAPDYPATLPELRRRLVIESREFGHEIHDMDLYRSDRIDCFRVVVDGHLWKSRIGWSQILAGLRKSMPRVGSSRSL